MGRQTVRSVIKQTVLTRRFSLQNLQPGAEQQHQWVVDENMTWCFLVGRSSSVLLVNAWGRKSWKPAAHSQHTVHGERAVHGERVPIATGVSERAQWEKCRYQTCVNVTYVDASWTQWSVAGCAASGHAGDKQLDVRGRGSYRSGVIFSGQGRLKDILAWNKAQVLVNSKIQK